MRLIVGLGNPGAKYAQTRHNVGALALFKAAERWSIRLQDRGDVYRGQGRVADVDVILVACPAWMNHSGPEVKSLLARTAASFDDLVVVHDDLDLTFGRIRIKRHGGAGGHRGVLSLLTSFESDQFCRLKIGIGNPPGEQDPADYVLSEFSSEEQSHLHHVLERSVSALESVLAEGVEAAMNRFNAEAVSE